MSWPVCTISEARATLIAPGAPFEMRDEKIGTETLRTYVHAPAHIRQVLDESRRFEGLDFLVHEGERITFEAHWRAANAFGRVLAETYGIEKGDRVAIAMRNYPEWAACAFGALTIGAIMVPLNAWETGERLARMIRESGAKLTVVDAERRERLEGKEHGACLLTVRDGAGEHSFERLVGPVTKWATLPDRPAPDRKLMPDDPSTLGFTSGTTGAAKGALGTHRGAMSNLLNTQYRVARAALRRGDTWPPAPADKQTVVLLPLPFFHATGLHSGLVPALARGTRLVTMYRWDLEQALALIEAERANILVLVPTLVEQLLQRLPEGGMPGLESVHTVTYGGSPASSDLAAGVQLRFPGASPAQGYGATEVTSLIASNSHEDLIERPDSVGTPVPCCDVKLLDDDGQEVATGEPGELWVRGPQVFRGYWGLEEATAEVKTDGWYRTGDIATMDEEGFIFIKDRKKDMVIRGGENIYCAEVEQAIGRIEGVLECAVFGLPDRILGEIVAASVVTNQQSKLTGETIQQHLAAVLAAFKVPAVVDVGYTPLPRNAAGKVMKQELRQRNQTSQEAE